MSGLKVDNAKNCAILVLLTPYKAMIMHTFLGTAKNDLEQTFQV